jgi:hypothetical protein
MAIDATYGIPYAIEARRGAATQDARLHAALRRGLLLLLLRHGHAAAARPAPAPGEAIEVVWGDLYVDGECGANGGCTCDLRQLGDFRYVSKGSSLARSR